MKHDEGSAHGSTGVVELMTELSEQFVRSELRLFRAMHHMSGSEAIDELLGICAELEFMGERVRDLSKHMSASWLPLPGTVHSLEGAAPIRSVTKSPSTYSDYAIEIITTLQEAKTCVSTCVYQPGPLAAKNRLFTAQRHVRATRQYIGELLNIL